MTDTRQKYLEASYFYACLVEKQTSRYEFRYILSAFLSAFRSVTFLMQKEFNKFPEFQIWYALQKDKMKSDEVFKLLHSKRTMTIHTNVVKPNAHINVSIHE
jgi:hypothetical protein